MSDAPCCAARVSAPVPPAAPCRGSPAPAARLCEQRWSPHREPHDGAASCRREARCRPERPPPTCRGVTILPSERTYRSDMTEPVGPNVTAHSGWPAESRSSARTSEPHGALERTNELRCSHERTNARTFTNERTHERSRTNERNVTNVTNVTNVSNVSNVSNARTNVT